MSWRAAQGLKAWVWQRLSAIYMVVYLLVFMMFAGGRSVNYQDWQSLFAQPFLNIATAGFILALCVHAWVGIRDVVLDYVHPYSLRLLLLAGVALTLILMFLWSLQILLLVGV